MSGANDDERFQLHTVHVSELPTDLFHGPDGTVQWGPWRLDPDLRVLYSATPFRYEIDLDECTSSARVLDRICQIAEKSWGDDATLAGLVRALNDVLQPQAFLCSGGQSKRLTKRKITALTQRAARMADFSVLPSSPRRQ